MICQAIFTIFGLWLLSRLFGGETVLVMTGPDGSGSASGSIQGRTWAHNRFGMYIRGRTTPVNPNTAAQQLIRNSMAFCTDWWATGLSGAQRTAWNLYASSVVMKNKLGQDMLLTGFNQFLRTNVINQAYGIAKINSGPTIFELAEKDETLSLTASEATQNLTISYDDTMAWAQLANNWLMLWQGKPQNGQRNFFAGPYTVIGQLQGNPAPPPPSPLVAPANPAIAQGQRLWIKARIQRSDGRLSEPFRSDVIVGA